MSKGHGVTNVGVNLGIGANADRDIILASDAKIYWDESEDEILTDVGIGTYAYQDNVLLKSAEATTETFYIKKPISAYFRHYNNELSPDTRISIYQNGAWRIISQQTGLGDIYLYKYNFNPGYYQLYSNKVGVIMYLYCTGVYGAPTVTASEIVT